MFNFLNKIRNHDKIEEALKQASHYYDEYYFRETDEAQGRANLKIALEWVDKAVALNLNGLYELSLKLHILIALGKISEAQEIIKTFHSNPASYADALVFESVILSSENNATEEVYEQCLEMDLKAIEHQLSNHYLGYNTFFIVSRVLSFYQLLGRKDEYLKFVRRVLANHDVLDELPHVFVAELHETLDDPKFSLK